jgi:hypothetical protein
MERSGDVFYGCGGAGDAAGGIRYPLSFIQSAIRCGQVLTVTNWERSPILNPCFPCVRKIASTGTPAACSFS